MTECSVNNCSRVAEYVSAKLCRPHYSARRTKKTFGGVCSGKGCKREVSNKKRILCRRCYMFLRTTEKKGKECSVDRCDNPPSSKGYCNLHYARLVKHGNVRIENGRAVKIRKIRRLLGENITTNGYRRIRTDSGKWILEHRHVMEKHLGRKLFKGENVHHKNGKRLDNRRRNLELWIKAQPNGIRVKDAVKWAKEILRRYGE